MVPSDNHKHVGFISTRLSGNDGVSLETRKWVSLFESEGFGCFYLAGELDYPSDRCMVVPEAHFRSPQIEAIQAACFGTTVRNRQTTQSIHQLKDHLKGRTYEFIKRFDLGLLVIENALAIPMNIPLGMALTELISETGIPTIAHHHDFYWERQRFLTNAVGDYLSMSFPPNLPSIHHVVISSAADSQLSLRTGISTTIIPNVMDFESPPDASDDYAGDIRQRFGIDPDAVFVLQPTRVVRRKGIEHAIELVKRLDMKAKLLISHASGDEGHDYQRRVRQYAELMDTDTMFLTDSVQNQRCLIDGNCKAYTPFDLYRHCDLVTYPSDFEGFGNAFLEAIYFGKPIVVNNYSIYTTDIKPKGFKLIELNGYVTDEAVERTREILLNEPLRRTWTEHNYELAKRHYSYSVLQRRLRCIICDCFGPVG